MSNQNITQRGIQATGLGIMIGKCSLENQHKRPEDHPASVGYPFFRYTNEDLRNHTHQRPKRKAWTREDKQLALYCYFRSNPTQRGYRKRMIEIWQECSNFDTTSQKLADLVRTIIKKSWFSDIEIIEIYKKINYQQSNNTVPDTSNINKQKQPNLKWKRHTTKQTRTKTIKRTKVKSGTSKGNIENWKDYSYHRWET